MQGYFVVTLLVCLTCVATLCNAANGKIKTWLTVADPATGEAIEILSPGELSLDALASSALATTVKVDLAAPLQPIEGFGAGLPQSSAHVLTQLKTSSPSTYDKVLTELFSPVSGAGLSILRFPIGSCDFSLRNTSYDEVANDFSLEHFAIDADSEKIVEVLLDVRKVNPELKLIGSPWSAPSWMKARNTLIAYSKENTLLDDDQIYDAYAAYLAKVVDAFVDRGLFIDYLTLQNEPLFGDGTEYAGMYVDAAQAVRLGKIVATKLLQAQARRSPAKLTRLLSYDHNWDHPEYPLATLATTKMNLKGIDAVSEVFYGVAWHCYGGDMTKALSTVRQQYPTAPQWITECTGAYPSSVCDVTKGLSGFGWNHEWDMRNLLLGAVGQFARASVKWIVALDETCGPVLPGVTFTSGRPLVSIPSTTQTLADVYWNQDFWSMRHLSQFLSPRSTVRVEHSTDAAGEGSTFLIEAFVTASSKTATVIAMNLQHSAALPLRCSIAGADGAVFSIEDELPAFATKVYQFAY